MPTIVGGSDLIAVAVLVGYLLAVIVAAAVGLARGRGLRPALWTVLVLTLALIGVITLGSAVTGQFAGQPGVSLVPFQEIQRGLDNRGSSPWTNLVGNIAMFLPLGFAIACLVRGGFWARVGLATVSGLVLSAAIEVTQYSFGRVADIDDIILNTSGALAGGVVGAVVAVAVIRTRRDVDPRSADPGSVK